MSVYVIFFRRCVISAVTIQPRNRIVNFDKNESIQYSRIDIG